MAKVPSSVKPSITSTSTASRAWVGFGNLCELPARLEEGLKQNPRLQELGEELLASYWKTLQRVALYNYQEKWVQERRDWQVLTRGKERHDNLHRADLVQSLSLLFPERGRLAQKLASDATMSSKERWLAMEDLYTLCTRDFSVLYLPGHQPVNGCCPVKCCQIKLDRKANAISTSKPAFAERLPASASTCRPMSTIVTGALTRSWELKSGKSNATHTSEIWAQSGVEISRTATRSCVPGYCPFCLGSSTEPAERRLQSWCRDAALWQHVDEHLDGSQWPRRCPHPLCTVSLADGQDLRFHFIDDHGLSRSLPKGMKHLGALPPHPDKEQVPFRKRKTDKDNAELSWPSHEQLSPARPPKKARRGSSTIAPSLLSRAEEKVKNPPPVIDLTASESSTEILAGPLSSHSEEYMWLPDEPECGSKSPIRFRSCHSTLVDPAQSDHDSVARFGSRDSTVVDSLYYQDDDGVLFSQFIRSPSPDCLPADVAAGDMTQTVHLPSSYDHHKIPWF